MKQENVQLGLLAFVLFGSLALWAKPDLETKFNPVVSELELVKSMYVEDGKQEVFVRFDKYRDCEFLGLRMNDPLGYRVKFDFLDKDGDSYQSRPEGLNVAGPWMLYTNFPIGDLRVESIHSCTGIFGDYKVMSVMNDGR